MEREIKFRGKDFKGDWHVGFYLYDDLKNSHFILLFDILNQIREVKVMPKTVGQFTGLKDKNGKEIFEGDILEDDTEWFSVIWDKDNGQWCASSKHIDLSLWEIADSMYASIQGNIYENPELLQPNNK